MEFIIAIFWNLEICSTKLSNFYNNVTKKLYYLLQKIKYTGLIVTFYKAFCRLYSKTIYFSYTCLAKYVFPLLM